MKYCIFWLSILVLLIASCGRKKDEIQSGITQLLDSLLVTEHEFNRFNGTVVVGNNDSIIYSKALGIANRVWNIPLQPDHRFDICSINKSFVAALVLMAVEESRIALDDRLVDVLSAYGYNSMFGEQITIHQMLTHTSGLPDYDGVNDKLSANEFRSFKRLHFSNHEYANFISELKPVNQPGKQFYYSNFGYHLLIILLEEIYQLPFSQLLDEKICKPLSLKHTFSTDSNQDVNSNVAEAYNYDKQANVWYRNEFIDLTLGRRIFSSTLDLYKWGKAMGDNSLLSEKSRAIMQSNHLSGITESISYGYGWVVFDGKRTYKMGDLKIEKKYIIHGGNTEGFKSMLVNIERGEFIVAILMNTGNQTDEINLTQKIVQTLTNK
ncbi:serine hydrolase domain-containing protein [Reichenbachiella sp. MALMAid0571]|uniref:serine hydrolase domain-containing protein n=1 Tax=Reichenbachiella sp. MALMAid0571 TaxID=3143939 RepID=UPI0032DF1691